MSTIPSPARRGAARLEPRAVLRPRFRARRHADLAPAARGSDLGRGRQGRPRPARRLVGVELHDLGDERARPRGGAGQARSCSAIMFASLVMAVAIPGAFGDRALLFAGAYVAIQVGRHAFLTFVVASRDSQEREPALHILIWFFAAGVFWLAARSRPGRRRSRCGSWRSRSTTRRRSSSTGCPGVRSSSRPRGTSRPRTSRSDSSCSSSSRSASRSSSRGRRPPSCRSASRTSPRSASRS